MEPPTEALRRLEQVNSDLRERHLRLAAEFDNFRKRAARERIELADRAQAALAVKLLDVLDDLDRVVAGAAADGSSDVVRQALVLIDRKLRKELEAAGLERIDPVGEPFDPALHEAVSVLIPPDPARDHTVSATFQAGYRFKGALIRPARVQVYSSEGHA
jgi:molecular chaperone GrpE